MNEHVQAEIPTDNWDEIAAQLAAEAIARRNRPDIDFDDVKAAILARLDDLIDELIPVSSRGKTKGDEFWCCNPTRPDKNPLSFSINTKTGTWYDFSGKQGGNILTLWCQVKGLANNTEAMFSIAKFLNVSERNRKPDPTTKKTVEPGKIVATYDYTDLDGTLLYQAVRYDPKDFRQRRPDGRGGWIWSLGDVKRVVYRWKRVSECDEQDGVFLCEGEKDADRLNSIGLRATTVAGDGKWTDDCVNALKGRHVTILPDNDEAGSKRAAVAVDALRGKAAGILIVKLPGLPEKGDESDWLDADPTNNASALLLFCISEAHRQRKEAEAENPKCEARDHGDSGNTDDRRAGQQQSKTRKKMLELVRAIMSKTVANGCTEGEAMAALAKARELMAAYEISESELGDGEEQTNEAMPDSDLPIIEIKDGQLSALATRAEEMLIDAGVPLYQRGDTLVRPIIETVDASRGRKTKVAQLRVLDTVYLRDLMGRHATWVKYDGRKKRMNLTNPPPETAATVMARVGEWKFKRITGVISTPTMRPDGSLLMEQGYDDVTGLLLVEPPPMPVIPDQPTKENALASLSLLEGLLVGFPFVDDVAKSVALSAMISPVVRGAFPVLPMHASRAPTAGSGKSFLFDTVAAIAIGQLMPVMSTGANTEEMEKRLGAAMLAGQPLISIDNISSELGGDALCQIIERPVVEIRILGRSERVRIEARGTSTFATGNNFVVVGDLCRRVLTVNLDTEVERPELRQFKFDPVERVLANRGVYIAAALTICRAYIVAGRPGMAPKLASFEGYSDTVRSALIWLGKADPVQSMENARAEDPERAELSDMLEAWGSVIGIGGGARLRLSDAILKGMSMVRPGPSYGETPSPMEPTYPELYAALEALAFRDTGKRGQKPDARLLGTWLRKFKGRIVNGRRFAMMADPSGKKSAEWWVDEVLAEPAMGVVA